MTIKFEVPNGQDSFCARLAGSIVQVIQQFNGEHPTPIYLVYGDNIKVDAMSILNWLEFAFHEHREFKLESELDNLKDLESEVHELFTLFNYTPVK